jgi:hypothetical protein
MLHDRKATRAAVELTPRYRTPTSFDYVAGRCVDLSAGGMFIVAPLPCVSGTLLKFDCTVDGVASALKGVARVVWRRTGGGEDRPSGMGLKFVRLEPGSEELITHLVSEAKAHGTTAPETPLPAHVRVTNSFPPQLPELHGGDPQSEPMALGQVSLTGAGTAATGPAHAQAASPEPTAAPTLKSLPSASLSNQRSGVALWLAVGVGAVLLAWLMSRSAP